MLTWMYAITATAQVQAEQPSDKEIRISVPVDIVRIHDFELSAPDFTVGTIPADVTIKAINQAGQPDTVMNGVFLFDINGTQLQIDFKNGVGVQQVRIDNDYEISVKPTDGTVVKKVRIKYIPFWLSIIPPIIAILMALIFKEVISALFLGIFSGALIIHGFGPSNWIPAALDVIDKYIVNALTDSGHISVIIFSMMIGGMVAVISRNGGMTGIVNKLSIYAKGPKSAQIITWFLGIAIFFDDYANTLIVGNTMRPVTDRFRISREKLSYLVDSTAAPVAAIAFVTTWIGAELGYIKDAVSGLNINEGAYSLFINSLQYAYYPIFTIIFMYLLIHFNRDFGTMLKAENRARKTGKLNAEGDEKISNEEAAQLNALNPIEGIQHRWLNAFVPVMVVVVGTIVSLLITGFDSSYQKLLELKVPVSTDSWGTVWSNLQFLDETQQAGFFKKLGIVIGNSDSYKSLLWSSLSGAFLALLLTISQGIMNLHQSIETLLAGFKTMLSALLILVMAWSLSDVTKDLHTADFLTSVFSNNVSPGYMPAITFVLAAAISFATGSSWGTMAILYPLILPATWTLCRESGMSEAESLNIFYHVISVVLAGSVFGDHCSPISDTTILSSMASGCNHIAHVNTQLPYAITVGLLSIFCSLVLVNIGIPWYIIYLIGIVLMILIVKFVGKEIDNSHA